MKYKFTFVAEKSYRTQASSPSPAGYMVLAPLPTVQVSVIAETYEEATEAALELLPEPSVPGHYWSLDVRGIEVQA